MTASEFTASVDAMAENRRLSILTSPNNLPRNALIYHVSPSGDDSSDGLSPLKPWKTLDRVNSFDFPTGSIVCFERGGIWRGQLQARGGVTYTAYGTGAKPCLYGSDCNYSECDWQSSGVKDVYFLPEPMDLDAGLIVFDEGAANGIKRVDGVDGFAGSPDALDGDLQFWRDPSSGILYLRSDRKPPQLRFASIEIAPHRHGVTVSGDGCTVDNLTIKYAGSHGIASGNRAGLTVSNCVLGWIGGSIQGINSTTRFGNAIEIYVSCRDYTVENCWIYQIYDAAVTHQFKGDSDSVVTMENVLYRGNLIEYCTYSIEYFLDQHGAPGQIMRDILIEDNICRFAGCGWGDQRPDFTSPAHVKGWRHANRAENFIIRRNIFDRSRYMMLHCGCSQREWTPLFEDNVLIQNRGGLFGGVGVNVSDSLPFSEIAESGFGDNKLLPL